MQDELRIWIHRIGLCAGLFVAGGLTAFAYSYLPLHAAKNWKIDHLQERLDSRIEQVDQLQRELKQLRSETSNKPDKATFDQIRQELESSQKAEARLEKKLASSKRRLSELERSRRSWKARFEEADAERKTLDAGSRARQSEMAVENSLPAAPAQAEPRPESAAGTSREVAPEPSPSPEKDPSAVPRRWLFAPQEPAE